MLNLNLFLDKFPEFAELDPLKVEETLEQVKIETDGYDGLQSAYRQDHAIALHTAHCLKCYQIATSTPGGGRVAKIKTKHDEIQYQAALSLYDLDSSSYGQRLQSFLSSQFIYVI